MTKTSTDSSNVQPAPEGSSIDSGDVQPGEAGTSTNHSNVQSTSTLPVDPADWPSVLTDCFSIELHRGPFNPGPM